VVLSTAWLEHGFWGLCVLVAYVYVGYPVAIALLARLRVRPRDREDVKPRKVTLIFCVHNELPVLRGKLDNCLSLDYPREALEILAASDGSTDGSDALLEDYRRRGLIKTFVQAVRSGKSAVLNRVVDLTEGEILLFTDASTLLDPDTVWKHVRHYSDPRVGCVGGELRFSNTSRGGVSAGHGFYWRYESWIRRSESALGILAYVPGANYSMRRALWKPVPPEFADDCVGPLNVVEAGWRVLYDPEATAVEVASETLGGLFSRRVRMVTRDLEATLRHGSLLNPLRHGGLALSILSHKILRWLVSLALVMILLLDVALARKPLFAALLVLQCAFYALAAVGSLRGGRPKSRLLSFPLYFCVSNLGALRGLVNVVLRRRIGIWHPVGVR
jgi:cellulose synthase/poly-beta-1,6-N-acetylglucosamine synthase-like glycosyltransferase